VRRRRRAALAVLALAATAVLAAGGGSTWSAFSATTSSGSNSFSSIADWTAPSVTASVIAHSASGAGVKASGTYAVYANVSDSGNPASGVASVTANVGSITTGQTSVALTACSSQCTVGGVTYSYKSAQLTAGAGLAAGSVSYTVTATDSAGNAAGAAGFSVTVDNTAPAASASVVAHAAAGAKIKASGTYNIYANATDGGSGVDTVTANVSGITTGQTSVALPPCPSACTVGGTTYAYKSAQLTANAGLASGSVGYTVTATDSAGNSSAAAGFTATVDNTAPTASDVQTANGGATTGRPELNDTVTLTFSEQIDPNTVVSGWTGSATNIVVRVSNAGAGNNDIVTFWNSANSTQLPLGSVNLGRAGFVNTSATMTFGASGTASSMVQSGTVVTITLGTPSGTANRVTNNTTMTWLSSTAPADLAGNLATGNTATEGGVADAEF
jgi:hypothetical protein